jgi:hypothetical protein
MAIPKAPAFDSTVNPRCVEQVRSADSAAGRMVEAAGWKVFAADVEREGLRVVRGLAGFDGMCRPMEYQAFVFVNAAEPSVPPGPRYVGTMSPVAMGSRMDGALNQIEVFGQDQPDRRVVGTFARYRPEDALCCPSAISTVTYRIVGIRGDPVLARTRTTTEPTGAAAPPAVPAPIQVPRT